MASIHIFLIVLAWSPLANAADSSKVVFYSDLARRLAKRLCLDSADLNRSVRDACLFDPTGGELVYESKIMTRFAVDPKCKGIQFSMSSDERSRLIVTQTPFWELQIDYMPGEQNQEWRLLNPDIEERVRQGKDVGTLAGAGNEGKIASDVCSVVTKRGADLE
jgi:hypothetical protein